MGRAFGDTWKEDKMRKFLVGVVLNGILIGVPVWAQEFAHPDKVKIEGYVTAAFAQIKTAQSDIVKGQTEIRDGLGVVIKAAWGRKYMQGLANPAMVPDGKTSVPLDNDRVPSDTPKGWTWGDLMSGPQPTDTARAQIEVHEYVGPGGVGFTLVAWVTQSFLDPAGSCLALRPSGPDCVWRYFEHVGPEMYRDNGELVWGLKSTTAD